MSQKGLAPIILILGIIVIATIASGAYYLGKSQVPKPVTPNPIAMHQSSSISAAAQSESFLSPDTKVANSLEAVALSGWQEVLAPKNTILNKIYIVSLNYDSLGQYSIQGGHYFKNTGPNTGIENQLEKNGWISTTPALSFTSFKLNPPDATGEMGFIGGWLGYKDGFIRMVSIDSKAKNAAPNGEPQPSIIVYDEIIFISDPIPLKDVISYINSSH